MINLLNLNLKNKGESGAKTIKEYFQLLEDKTNEMIPIINETYDRSTLTQDVILKSGFSFSGDRKYFVARNNTFDLNVMILSEEALSPSTFTSVAKISEEYAPLRDLFFSIYCDDGVGGNPTSGVARITTTGNIEVRPTNNVKRVAIHQTWIR